MNRLGIWVINHVGFLFYPFVVVTIGIPKWDWHLLICSCYKSQNPCDRTFARLVGSFQEGDPVQVRSFHYSKKKESVLAIG